MGLHRARKRRPFSLAAERAVRLLRERGGALDSRELAREILATRAPDETTARRILETAFAGDARLRYTRGRWRLSRAAAEPTAAEAPAARAARPEPDRVLVVLQGARPGRRQPFQLRELAAIRLRGDTVVAACGGRPLEGGAGAELRNEVRDLLRGAVPVVHDPPGALRALERWLDEPLQDPLSVRELAHRRLGLPARHSLGELAARLRLRWVESEDLVDQASVLDAALAGLRGEGETLSQMRDRLYEDAPRVPWERYAFDRDFLRDIPRVPGTYRFFDRQDRLLYVGKAKNLHERIASYFRAGTARSARRRALIEVLHRIEYDPLGSELEAMLREAALIRRRRPAENVQRQVHVHGHHRSRMRSVMILEPTRDPWLFCVYLLHDGRLVGKVPVGPRGGGLSRIRRLLDDRFFAAPAGPTPAAGPEVDVELVGRWLAENRERVVAFDPTSLRSTHEVMLRLEAVVRSGALFDPDGSPILQR